MSCRRETRCRICQGEELRLVLDLGETPLANRLLEAAELARPEPRFPLRVAFCPACSLLQLTDTVDPELLFRDYVYFSSFSEAIHAHSQRHAEELIAARGLGPDSLVVEVASNDGYLLRHFVAAGVPSLGVEPARNIAKVAIERGVPTVDEFFGLECARGLRAKGYQADVLLGNNVLAHVADLNDFVAGAAHLLRPEGVVEFEFPYAGDLVDQLEFDTIYHEHLCYFSVHAVEALLRRHGLALVDVRWFPIHGGSLRVTGTRGAGQAEGLTRVDEWRARERERGLDRWEFYADFGQRVERLGEDLRAELRRLKGEGRRLAAYGASAKGSTLLNVFGIGADLLEFVADRSTVKQGKFTPGTHLPIRDPAALLSERPDVTLLLTWNFAEEIFRQQADYLRAGGRFLVPVPRPRLVDAAAVGA